MRQIGEGVTLPSGLCTWDAAELMGALMVLFCLNSRGHSRTAQEDRLLYGSPYSASDWLAVGFVVVVCLFNCCTDAVVMTVLSVRAAGTLGSSLTESRFVRWSKQTASCRAVPSLLPHPSCLLHLLHCSYTQQPLNIRSGNDDVFLALTEIFMALVIWDAAVLFCSYTRSMDIHTHTHKEMPQMKIHNFPNNTRTEPADSTKYVKTNDDRTNKLS